MWLTTAVGKTLRVLCLDRESGAVAHRQFTNLPALLEPGDLLVFNDTRVIPARLYGRKDTGGRVEALLEWTRSIEAGECPYCGGSGEDPFAPRSAGTR